MGRGRRLLATVVRALVVVLLAVLLADPLLARRHDRVSLVTIFDRSLSVPGPLQEQARAYLLEALAERETTDRLSVINVGERAVIEQLDSGRMEVREREMGLRGEQTDLAAGVQLGMAIVPPESAVRFLLVSDGNETTGDLREASRIAAANGIPIDVLPLTYQHEREVFLRRLAAPSTAGSGQTVSLRFVLGSTSVARGKLLLSLGGQPVDLDPTSDGVGAEVELKPGTNVKTISLPVGTRGLHEFEAAFVPDGPTDDTLAQNNKATSMTYVAGPGHILVVDQDGESSAALVAALRESGIDLEYARADAFPQSLPELLDTDAVVLVNTSASAFNEAQQELICHFVRELGGGLVMVGGPQAYGAGGWIGSSVAEVLPVDVDPPHKKQMPKGALVLMMHSCEMPMGNYWGKQVALAAIGTLSRLDEAGVISYGWDTDQLWDYPLGPVGDKRKLRSAIQNMQMGDMPDFGGPMQEAYDALVNSGAAQKHVIMISDGDPAMPSGQLMNLYQMAGITVTGVAVFPHSPADVASLQRIAQVTGGRFYNVKDPKTLPQIFIKEAQTVKRALINEEDFLPKVVGGLSELVRGMRGVPQLSGYVLTGPKGGAAEMLITGPEDDPVLAAWQVGVGRCVAFTSSADPRWAAQWIAWGGFTRFWEQTVRWAAKSRQAAECVVFADVQGRDVTVTAEALDSEGNFIQYTGLTGRVVTPGMTAQELGLVQVGPGQYRARFRAGEAGSYLVNLRYQKAGGGGGMVQTIVNVPYAPEFRDLTDNAGLLDEVARETGGRVLTGPPDEVNLFAREGLVFPRTLLPLAQALMGVWLVLFLCDVGSRRLAVDVGAAMRRADAWLRTFGRGGRGEEAAHIARLQRRTQRLRRQMEGKGAAREAAREAARRFEAPAGAGAEMPDEKERPERPRPTAPPAPEEKEEVAGPEPSTGASHLDRLLKARRRARKRGEDQG